MASPTFSSPTDKEQQWVADQLEGARMFVAAMSPADANKSISLAALDRAFSAWLPQSRENPELINPTINVVGIQFGEFLVRDSAFEWVIASDAIGTDLAILALPGSSDVLVYPANFVAKRWERNEANFIETAYHEIMAQLQAIESGRPQPRKKPWWKFWT